MTKDFLIMKWEHPYGKSTFFIFKLSQTFSKKVKKLKKELVWWGNWVNIFYGKHYGGSENWRTVVKHCIMVTTTFCYHDNTHEKIY